MIYAQMFWRLILVWTRWFEIVLKFIMSSQKINYNLKRNNERRYSRVRTLNVEF